MKKDKIELQKEALNRATQNISMMNYPEIFRSFIERGIPEDDIIPRENVLTYNAWLAVGRQVKKGEHGVRVLTWIQTSKDILDEQTEEIKNETHRRPHSATVFHISQTQPVGT